MNTNGILAELFYNPGQAFTCMVGLAIDEHCFAEVPGTGYVCVAALTRGTAPTVGG